MNLAAASQAKCLPEPAGERREILKYAPSSIVFESGPVVDSGGIMIYNVPSSLLVQASIVGDTAHFRIKGMVSTYLATVPFDPAENWDTPPAVRRKYQDGTIPRTEKRETARVEGESPIWVVGGSELHGERSARSCSVETRPHDDQ